MSFQDIFKKSFLEAISTGDISVANIFLILGLACVFAAYIFFIYRVLTRKSFYSKEFNISLAIIVIIVAAIVITIQSSLVVSLGMVGALSIVRFRTAVKSPMDLVFLFWSIAIGIIVGAGLPGIALIMTGAITLGIYILNQIPVVRASKLLIINSNKKESKDIIIEVVKKNAKYYEIKSQIIENNNLDMIIEIRSKDTNNILDEISSINGVNRCSLLDHDGEVTF